MSEPCTLPALLVHLAEVNPRAIALREKVRGSFRIFTWAQSLDEVARVARGLAGRGFSANSRLFVVGTASARQLWAILAALGLGGIVVALARTSEIERFEPGSSRADFVLVSGADPWTDACEVAALETVRAVIVDDPRDKTRDEETRDEETRDEETTEGEVSFAPVLSLHALAWTHRYDAEQERERFRGSVSTIHAEDVAFAYQPGGPRALWQHGAVTESARVAAEELGITRADRGLYVDALDWSPAVVLGLAAWLTVGFELAIPEEPASAERDGQELGITYHFAPAARHDAWSAAVLGRFAPPRTLRRRLTDWALRVGAEDSSWAARFLARTLVLTPLCRVLGSSRWRIVAAVDGEPAADTRRLFSALAVTMRTITVGGDLGGTSAPEMSAGARPEKSAMVALSPAAPQVERWTA